MVGGILEALAELGSSRAQVLKPSEKRRSPCQFQLGSSRAQVLKLITVYEHPVAGLRWAPREPKY